MSAVDYLDYAAVAALTGVKPSTLRKYAAQGRMPAPDVTIGRTPAWTPATIEQWLKSRPGQGKGGGRPKKSSGL